MSQGGTLKLSINLSRGECTPIEPKDDQMTESNEGATGENEENSNTESRPSSTESASSASSGTLQTERNSTEDAEFVAADEEPKSGRNSRTDTRSAEPKLLTVPTHTKNSRKRKHILTNFDDSRLLNQSTLDAQQKEKERLERLKKKDAENDHIDQFAALRQQKPSSPLPVLDVNDIDIYNEFDSKNWMKNEGQPTTSKGLIQPKKDYEVIDLSSDDEDIKEVGSYQRERIEPRLSYNGRRRWALSDKEKLVQFKMEEQQRIEQERLKKRRAGGDDIEQIDLAAGRLLVNRGHPATDPDICVAPHLTHILQPHQLGGIRFMYDNVIESLDDYKNSPGFGCILAHSMGLGKTIQVVTFTDVFFRATGAHKILIIVPVNTIQNWYTEFDKWIPKYAVTGEKLRNFEVFILGDTVKTFDQRVNLLEEWKDKGGALLIGYDMFRLLIKATQPKKAARPKLNFVQGAKIARDEKPDEYDQGFTNDGRIKKEANAIIRSTLLDPGPDLVVCDEGHKIKNLTTDIASALGSIRTTRRIVLTGYPLQNNLMEYYCMVDFVRPKYLGEKKSFSIMFEKPIKNGQCVDSTPGDIKLAMQRTHVLVEMLKGFVQRRTHHLLKTILPKSKEYVLLLRKSPIQHLLYRNFLLYANAEIASGNTGNVFNPLKAFAACSKIWNHPDVLSITLTRQRNDRMKAETKKNQNSPQRPNQRSLQEAMNNMFNGGNVNHNTLWDGVFNSSAADLDIADEDEADKPARGRGGRGKKTIVSALMDDLDLSENGLKYDWADVAMAHYQCGVVENGYKMKIALDIIDETTMRNEKILLFSQNLTALDLIEQFLSKRSVAKPDGTGEQWSRQKNYFRLDGSTNGTEREKLVNRFNGDPNLRLFLISTRAGSLGINLVSANRCIIFDACWNPCHDAQAVCRVYRYGQQRRTYIYRLIMDNSMEKAIFNRQISKHGLQQRVVDDAKVEANVTQRELETLLMYDESLDVVTHDWDTSLWDLEDDLLTKVIERNSKHLSQEPFLHESLILEKEDGLSEQEKLEAQLLYDREKAFELAPANLLDPYGAGPSNFMNVMKDRGTPSWLANMQNGLDPNGLPPLKSTPMAHDIHMVGSSGMRNNYNMGGYNNYGNGVYGNQAGGNYQNYNNGHQHNNGNHNPNQYIQGLSFPGARMASNVVANASGTMQKIVTDRPMQLPLVQNAQEFRTVEEGSEVVLVKAGAGGVYIKTSNGEILNAERSVFGHQAAQLNLGGQALQLPPRLAPRNPQQANNVPEVIDLD